MRTTPCDRFICVGNIGFDLIFPVDRMPEAHEKLRCPEAHGCCGGSAANAAYWLAGFGHSVAMVGCIGDDENGRSCRARLRAIGVGTEGIQVKSNASTAIAAVFSSPSDKRMVTARGANDMLDLASVPFEIFGPDAHVHVSLLVDEKAVAVLREARNRGASTSSEFNGVKSEERVAHCDVCFMNQDEFVRWMGPSDPVTGWRQRFGDLNTWLVVTQGHSGAKAVHQNETLWAPAVPTQLVDRTGGGDAFDAGYLTGMARQLPPQVCLRMGLELASHVIQHFGATPMQVNKETLCNIARRVGR